MVEPPGEEFTIEGRSPTSEGETLIIFPVAGDSSSQKDVLAVAVKVLAGLSLTGVLLPPLIPPHPVRRKKLNKIEIPEILFMTYS
jgi:hypothetical protein